MRVLTLDSAAFGRICRELAGLVVASGFEPQLIVGIRRGGEYVACEMRPCFSRAALGFVGLKNFSVVWECDVAGNKRQIKVQEQYNKSPMIQD